MRDNGFYEDLSTLCYALYDGSQTVSFYLFQIFHLFSMLRGGLLSGKHAAPAF